MPKSEATDARTVALYWDFENIHAGLCEEREPGSYRNPDARFRPQEPLVNVEAVVDLAASFGPIAINRAYCNWQFFGRYRDALLQNAVELVQLFPPGGAAKNGADIKLCLDATEDIGRFAHIGTVIIVGGDSDFMPVSQKIKAAGRTLIGVGTRKATNRHWAKSCHEFRYYENLVEVRVQADAESAPAASGTSAEPSAGVVAAPEARPDEQSSGLALAAAGGHFDLVRRAMRLLAEKHGDPWINKAEILPMVKRLDPTFDVVEHGYTTFSGMLKGMEPHIEVRKSEYDQQIRLR
ncbi:NYN domain-containing protein [Ramlibacter rhizophilus]|uniref:NYN domain-containing protein n=1 Tax=Ramlibacter rhizophilus TaxID=1781167 RepID=A0A4Z0BZB0_9BURK|nr:NYN domain-containing protein [Ramlibacter rhizophilus]TFZ03299.1 NYN domain-containing protein [Ramlibacter rhizophilus]